MNIHLQVIVHLLSENKINIDHQVFNTRLKARFCQTDLLHLVQCAESSFLVFSAQILPGVVTKQVIGSSRGRDQNHPKGVNLSIRTNFQGVSNLANNNFHISVFVFFVDQYLSTSLFFQFSRMVQLHFLTKDYYYVQTFEITK